MKYNKQKQTTPQRRGLLAKVHIAKKELGLGDLMYRDTLRGRFGVKSAADLRDGQLEELVRYFKHLGWRPIKSRGQRAEGRGQIEALRERAAVIAAGLENGEKRLLGLVKKICGCDRIEWCRDARKLKRLLAAIEKIKRNEDRNDYNSNP